MTALPAPVLRGGWAWSELRCACVAGERQKVLDWLLSYNPLWLRIGLEVRTPSLRPRLRNLLVGDV